jgi:hypothetical protein
MELFLTAHPDMVADPDPSVCGPHGPVVSVPLSLPVRARVIPA